jgi:hypothetical protein
MRYIASSFVFVAVETCSNNLPSSSGAFRVAMGTCSAKPRPADGQIAAFRLHAKIYLSLVILWFYNRFDQGYELHNACRHYGISALELLVYLTK